MTPEMPPFRRNPLAQLMLDKESVVLQRNRTTKVAGDRDEET
jgi:hypothetical protein